MTNTIVTPHVGPENARAQKMGLESLRSHDLAITRTHPISVFQNL